MTRCLAEHILPARSASKGRNAPCWRCGLAGFCLFVFGLSASAAPRVDRHGDPLPDGAIARLGTIRQRVVASHLAISADGRTLITVAAGRLISRWDAASGRLRENRLLPGKPTNQFWLSADGRLLAVNEDGKRLAIFDPKTGTRKHLLAVPTERVAFRADGKALVTSDCEKLSCRVRLWDLATGKDHLLAELPSYVNDLAFRPDGKRLFAADNNHSLRCWDLERGEQLWKTDPPSVSGLAMSPDGRTLCSNTYQQMGLHLWDAATGRRIGGGLMGKNCWIGRLTFAPDGRTVFLTDYKDVLLWDVATGKARRRLAGAGRCFAVAPDGKTLASIAGALLQRWDVETGKPLYADTSAQGHTSAVCGVVFAPNGQGIVTIGAEDTIRYWELSTQRPRTLFTDVRPRFGSSSGSSPDSWRTFCVAPQILAITADGRRLLSQVGHGQLRVSDIRTGEEVRRFDVRSADNVARVGAARLSADGRTLWTLPEHAPDITGGMREVERKETLIGWDMATGRQLSSHVVAWCGTAWYGDVTQNIIAPDGRFVALENGNVRDVASARERLKEGLGLSYPCAFSADSLLVAMADLRSQDRWDTIAVHDLLTGRRLIRLDAPISWSSHFVFSPDGRLLIAAGADALHVWEVSSGQRLLHLPAKGRLPDWSPGSFATCLAVAPDGRSAATGHEDGTVLLWDLATAWRRLAERQIATLTTAELDSCWADLLKGDPRTAYSSMDRLAAASAQTLPLLHKHLRPVTIESQWLERRLADLDSSAFATREKASRDLEAVAEAVEQRLRRAMAKGVSLEVRRRLQAILETERALVLPAEIVRQLRAVAVLERIATEPARGLLKELARGESAARLSRAANAALARLAARHAP